MLIYLAGGCFWGVQGYFDLLKGVEFSQVGYANSNVESPSYQDVCSGWTNAVEAVEITFDETILPLEKLLRHFFKIINPFALKAQYRSGIYTKDSAILPKIHSFVESLGSSKPIVIEIQLLKNFYPAESYHQKYLAKNPNGYCHLDLSSALKDC